VEHDLVQGAKGAPGVSIPAYLATTRTEQSYVVTVLAENRSQPIDGATILFGGQGSVHAGGAPLGPFRTQEPK
jgi:hypothetical protein